MTDKKLQWHYTINHCKPNNSCKCWAVSHSDACNNALKWAWFVAVGLLACLRAAFTDCARSKFVTSDEGLELAADDGVNLETGILLWVSFCWQVLWCVMATSLRPLPLEYAGEVLHVTGAIAYLPTILDECSDPLFVGGNGLHWMAWPKAAGLTNGPRFPENNK